MDHPVVLVKVEQYMITFQMALSLWNATGNVQTWLHKLSLAKETYTATEAGLGFTWGHSDVFEKKFGILKEVAAKICATTFENDIAKLTLEIADPRMLEVVKDKRVTFADMLGTVGEAKLKTHLCSGHQRSFPPRRNYRPVHWAEYNKRL